MLAVAEYGTSRVIVSATEENHEKVAALIEEIDKETTRTTETKIIKLAKARADQLASTLTNVYARSRRATRRGEQPVTITADLGTNSLIVSATKAEFPELEAMIQSMDVEPEIARDRLIKPFKLVYADPSAVASAITSMFRVAGPVSPRDEVTATPEWYSQTVIVSASKENMARVEELIGQIDSEEASGQKVRVIELKYAEAYDVAQSLSQVFVYAGARTRRGQTAVTISNPPGTNQIVVKANDVEFAEIERIVGELDRPEVGKAEEMAVVALEYVDANETLEIMREYLRKPGAGRGLAGDVRLSAARTQNALVISGSKEEVSRLKKLVEDMDQPLEGAGTAPQIIQLTTARASQLAQALTQMFTDPARRRRGVSEEMVPIILPDETTNSLLVRARPPDFKLIEKMAKDLDSEDAPGLAGLKVIQVAEGIDVRDLAREIESTINTGEQHRVRQQPGARPQLVSIGADERTNAIIVAGAPAQFAEVEKLVKELEGLKPTGPTRVRILPLRNIDPQEVQRVLDQLLRWQGKSSSRGGRRSSLDPWKDQLLRPA